MLVNIIKENYYITKFTHTSYKELDDITRYERTMLLKFVLDDIKSENEKLKNIKNTLH